MSSIRRILASRANGALSKGPKTPEGKKRSSRNAVKHGLLASHIVLDDESAKTFKKEMNFHLDRLQPADGMEQGPIEDMVAARWRHSRALAIESRMLQNACNDQQSPDPLDRLTNAFSDLASRPGFALMHRYQTRLNIEYQRALCNLLLLRTASVPNEPNLPMPHAALTWTTSTPVAPATRSSAEVIEMPSPDSAEPDDIAA